MEEADRLRAAKIRQARQSCERSLRGSVRRGEGSGRGRPAADADPVKRPVSAIRERAFSGGEPYLEEKEEGKDLLGRLIVAAGIFLLLFLCGRYLKPEAGMDAKNWVRANGLYETAVETAATFVEERLPAGWK